jgi:hypothetical protein
MTQQTSERSFGLGGFPGNANDDGVCALLEVNIVAEVGLNFLMLG